MMILKHKSPKSVGNLDVIVGESRVAPAIG